MIYVELPLSRIAVGQPIPVNIFDGRGKLLIRKGQTITGEAHKEKLASHRAQVTELDLQAWQRSHDRLVYAMLRGGRSLEEILNTPLPGTILDVDYAVGFELTGGWLDLHEALNAVLYHGEGTRNAMQRLDAIQSRATALLRADPNAALFTLFQALPDATLPYSSKHALLAAVISDLTAQTLQVDALVRPVLFQAALTMNISIARLQDALVRQTGRPTADQQRKIVQHPARSVELLRGLGLVNEDLFDIVGGHRIPLDGTGLPRNLECRQILQTADQFIAKMAPRATRIGQMPILAAKSIVADPDGKPTRIGSAMSRAVGFYPPGTYVKLANGETAVAVRRGGSANAPLVISVIGAGGMAQGQYTGRDTTYPQYAVRAAVGAAQIKVRLDRDRLDRAADKLRLATE